MANKNRGGRSVTIHAVIHDAVSFGATSSLFTENDLAFTPPDIGTWCEVDYS